MVKPVSFVNPDHCSAIFDSENRSEWQNTPHILAKLNLKEDSIVADVGAGTGYFASQFAKLAPKGRIYALDTEPNMVSFMSSRFRHEQLRNVVTEISLPEDPSLPAKVDIVFLANVYRFIRKRPEFLASIFSQIDCDTSVFIIDYKGENARVKPYQALDEIRMAGFRVEDMDMSGCPDHYIMKCKKGLSL